MPSQYSSSGGSGGGSVSIPEITTDPVSPAAQSAWILYTPTTGGGTPIGLLLSLTYPGTGSSSYKFSYKTIEGPIVRVTLT